MDEIRELYAHLQKAKHDAKHHITLLETLLETGRVEEAYAYLKEYSSSEQLLKMDKVCSRNMVVNYLISMKSARMQEAGIHFTCSICDQITGVSDVDLNILLGNLFDNAIEACERRNGIREISLTIKRRGAYLVIIMENTAGENVSFAETAKPDKVNHGYGLSSMDEIAERYGGRVHREQVASEGNDNRDKKVNMVDITNKIGQIVVPNGSGTTNGDGNSTVGNENEDGEEITLTVKVEDYETKRPIENCEIKIGNSGNILVKLPDGVDMDENNRITVTVTDNKKNPQEDMTIIVENDLGRKENGKTDEDGKLTVPPVSETEHHAASSAEA